MNVTLICIPPEPDCDFYYQVGKHYKTQEGKIVQVLGRTDLKGYECLICSDGIYRYDRSTRNSDHGRVTGTCHKYTDPRNFERYDYPKVK